MNYIGSKLSLLEFLEKSIEKVVDKNSRVFCDLFAGTGAVGTYFKRKGYKVIANDIQYYSFVLNKQYIENHQHLKFLKLAKILPELNNIEVSERKNFVCDYLSSIKGEKGFIYKNYCLGGTKNQEYERQYFSDENALRIDTFRNLFEEWKDEKKISELEYYYLITSLLKGVNLVSNVSGTYAAYLKTWDKRALNPLKLEAVEIIPSKNKNKVFKRDANELIKEIANADNFYQTHFGQETNQLAIILGGGGATMLNLDKTLEEKLSRRVYRGDPATNIESALPKRDDLLSFTTAIGLALRNFAVIDA